MHEVGGDFLSPNGSLACLGGDPAAPFFSCFFAPSKDALRTFIDRNCGDGTLYATPTEFMRDVLREKKERLEAAELRAGILEGYQDSIAGRTRCSSGSHD